MERAGVKVPYLVGTMIELPRAALRARDIAETAEFFSFGTNDLTQTVFGLSRDDSASFIGTYQKAGIFEHDPFVTLDVEGVGELVRIAAERGRAARPGSKARHLRRAWRRPGLDPLLPGGRPRLCVVLALSGADRPPGRRAGGAGRRAHRHDGMSQGAGTPALGRKHIHRRHGRACPGHPRLFSAAPAAVAWMPGSSPGMTSWLTSCTN